MDNHQLTDAFLQEGKISYISLIEEFGFTTLGLRVISLVWLDIIKKNHI